ncbi:MAG TPA: hypothetical protein VFF69_08015 [Phycisphaerales bacterium]|nr:hypothetical protein [Phycisphaerales bacterium]
MHSPPRDDSQNLRADIAKLSGIAPLITTGVVLLLIAHSVLYSLLKRGVLGRTPASLMATPVLVYFLSALLMLLLAAWLALKGQVAAVWYSLAGALLVGGLMMAIIELDHFLQVV